MSQPSSSTKQQYSLVNILFLTITPPLALALAAYHLYRDGFMWQIWALALAFYFIAGLSITAGYHRLIAHRAYKAHPLLEALFLFFGAGAFQNSALKWCTDHRRHHTKCDSDEDPYSITKGFFYAHMGWIFEAETIDQTKRWGKELYKNPRIMFQHRYYLPMSAIAGFGLPLLIGAYLGSALGGLAVAGLLRVVVVHHATFLINSLCHVWGTQPYGDDNTAKDSRLMAIFTYGEGHHNYHHHFQADYRNGVAWYDFDPTKWLIAFCAKLGLARDLVITDEEDILQAKLKMQLKRAKDKNHQNLSTLEEKFGELRAALRELKQKRKALMARQWPSRDVFADLKRQFKAERDLLRQRVQEFQGLLIGL